MLNKEAILARLEVLQRDLQSLNDNFYARKGAIADCEYWLKELEKEEKKDG